MKLEKVAIFENNEDFLQELLEVVSNSGEFEVCGASSNGNTAIEMIKRGNPAVAVVDLVLTGLDGFGVLDYIRENNRLQSADSETTKS